MSGLDIDGAVEMSLSRTETVVANVATIPGESGSATAKPAGATYERMLTEARELMLAAEDATKPCPVAELTGA
jgi:hypothetical protein